MPDIEFIRGLSPGESVHYSHPSMLGYAPRFHLIKGNGVTLLVKTVPIPGDPYETVIEIPEEASRWLVDAMVALLLPPGKGGTPGSTLFLDHESPEAHLRIRRTMSVEAEDDPGFTVIDLRRPQPPWGNVAIAWSDRLLFDGGLFEALHVLAKNWAAAHAQESPRPEASGLRPNWMGKSPADTPTAIKP